MRFFDPRFRTPRLELVGLVLTFILASSNDFTAFLLTRFKVARIQALRASFDVAIIQARRASECIFTRVLMHSLARRACIDNAWCFEFPRKIRRELIVLTKTAQRQNAQASAFLRGLWCPRLRVEHVFCCLRPRLLQKPRNS